MSADAPLVELRGITKTFGGVHAVEDVSLELAAGEVLGLLGHNGAGKSTLIKILSGVFAADSGEIRIDGSPVDDPLDRATPRRSASRRSTRTSRSPRTSTRSPTCSSAARSTGRLGFMNEEAMEAAARGDARAA